jgi:hypothetical protein
MSRRPRILLVGNPDTVHVAGHLRRAAHGLHLQVELCDARLAFAAPLWRQKVNWWVRGRRPARLGEFSASVLDAARRLQPDVLLATGLAPVDRATLERLGEMDIARLNFLTDDPWSPVNHAPWFLEALPHYDRVFSPRRANLADLAAAGVSAVHLSFAYSPDVHFPQQLDSEDDRSRFDADVMFAGGGDPDRVAILEAFIRAGLKVALYGGYWERYRATRRAARGHLDAEGLRKAVGAARLCVCLVRRSNRDGHAMRTFEVPAMAGCVLAEGTDEQRALLGPERDAACFFDGVDEAIEKARQLLAEPDARRQLSARAHARVTSGPHTYADRLAVMLQQVEGRWSTARS